MSRPEHRVAGLAIAAALALIVLAGCSKTSSNDGHPPAQNPAGAANFGPAPSAGATPGLTPGPVTYPATAGAYASAATTAWSGGDTTRLGQLTDSAATIWTTLNSDNYNKQFGLYQCTGAAGSSICVLYNSVGDELDLQIRNDRIGLAQAVIGGKFIPITFPADMQAYCAEAITAWGDHNTAAVSLLTGKPGDTAFSAVPNSLRGNVWTADGGQGAAGHLDEVFRDAADNNIICDFINPGIQPPPPNRHGWINTIYFTPHP